MDRNEKLTDVNGKRTKSVMVRLPITMVEHIDRFAGYTHSSRPDFITDAIRRYIGYILRESSSVTVQIKGLEVSDEAKRIYFSQQMSERINQEYELYKRSKKGRSGTKEISVLISMPLGLYGTITDTVEFTGIFNGNQEFIKVAIYHLFALLDKEASDMNAVSSFHTIIDRESVLKKELEQIRSEIDGKQS